MDTVVTTLRDPMARTILAFIAICTTLVLFLLGQWWWRRKALTFAISETLLLTVHEDGRGRVQILFDGVPASDVRLVVITLRNSGSEPIRKSDFERAVRFHYGDTAQILTLDVIETKPSNLNPMVRTIEIQPNAVGSGFALDPLLLNKGDSLKVKALVNQMGKVTVNGRIAGVREIKQVSTSNWHLSLTSVIGVLSLFPIMAAVFLYDYTRPRIIGVRIQQDTEFVEPGGQVYLSMAVHSYSGFPTDTMFQWTVTRGYLKPTGRAGILLSQDGQEIRGPYPGALSAIYYAPNVPDDRPVIVRLEVRTKGGSVFQDAALIRSPLDLAC